MEGDDAGTPAADADAPADAPSHVLVVDDLPDKLLVLEAALEPLGQRVVCVRSGLEALRAAALQDFAVVLLDVHMPELDGLETARRLRADPRAARTPIIFVTAHADPLLSARAYALGAVDFIYAPVRPEVLRAKVKVFVELQAMQRRLQRQAEQRVALAAAEERSRRAAFLARCGEALGASLELPIGMEALLRQVVPALADRAWLLVDGDGDHGPAALMAHCGPGPAEVRIGPVPGHHALHDAIAGVRSAAARIPGAPLGQAAGGLAWPLSAGGSTLGVLVVPESDRLDRALLADLADRAGIAFENMRLVQRLRREVAERRAAEERLRESHRRKDEFLAMLSHELRNPLAPIRHAIELIRRLAPAEPRLAWAIEVGERQVRQMTQLVENLLDVARISQGSLVLQPAAIDLRQAVRRAVDTVAASVDARGLQLVQSLPDGPVPLHGDEMRLAQAVGQLLVNAAAYTPPGGRIEVTLTAGADGWAELRVADTGDGIEPALLPEVFEAFRQGPPPPDRGPGGLGIGLTLVRQLVELHHGSVEAESAGRGQGSEFRLRLPMGAALPSAAQARKAARVLVVDDDDAAAETLGLLLRHAGHDVRLAADGTQALTRLADFTPDVVLVDVGLPNLDAQALAQRLRAEAITQHALLVALTGLAQAADAARMLPAGLFDAQHGPAADQQLLLQTIAAHLALAQAAAQQSGG